MQHLAGQTSPAPRATLQYAWNTAKLARDLKDNTLGLAKANLQNANLERIAKEASTAKAKLEQETVALRKKQEESERMAEDLTRRLQAMEAMMARGMGNPLGQGGSESPATHSDTAGQQAAAESHTANLGTYIQEENEGPRGAYCRQWAPLLTVGTEGVGLMPLGGITLIRGVTGIQWSGDMDQSMSSMTKSLTRK